MHLHHRKPQSIPGITAPLTGRQNRLRSVWWDPAVHPSSWTWELYGTGRVVKLPREERRSMRWVWERGKRTLPLPEGSEANYPACNTPRLQVLPLHLPICCPRAPALVTPVLDLSTRGQAEGSTSKVSRLATISLNLTKDDVVGCVPLVWISELDCLPMLPTLPRLEDTVLRYIGGMP